MMRSRTCVTSWIVVAACALAVGACGGKILEEPGVGEGAPGQAGGGRQGGGSSGRASSGGSSGTSGSSGFDPAAPGRQEPPSSPWPEPGPAGKSGVAGACETICLRDGRCGALQSDCNAYCENEINSAAACSPEALAYIQCYADNLEVDACSALPPVCEPAYCAYTRCTGKVVPTYCR